MDVETLKTTPKSMHVGVLIVSKKPMYIVEVIEEGAGLESQYITVYEVEPDSSPPIKAYDRVEVMSGYRTTTPLGALASKLFKSKKKVYKEDKPPLFMADIEYGVDTFTGKHSRGFYEREKDTVKFVNNKVKIVFGEKTGVFVGLDSITWVKLVIAPEDVYREYKARKTLWYL